jgi:arabinogalactan oligomer/maltooligosaccharide transport system substrate-binding protein
MGRMIRGAAAMAGLALALTACGSDSGGSSSSESGAAQSGSSLTIWADEQRAAPIGNLAKQWGEENGVNVTVTQVNFDDMKDQYNQQAPNGQGPDIFLGANDWAGEFQTSGLIAPIDLGSNAENFVPTALEGFNVDGANYGVPVAVENVIMFRNTTLAPNAPATINEMATTGLQLQSEGKTQFPIGLQVGEKGDAYHAYPMYSAAGGYFFGGPNAEGQYDPNDLGVGKEGSLTFATAWAQLGQQGAVRATFTGDDLKNAWSAGQLPYWITGPWNATTVEESGVPFVAEPVPGWEGVSAKSVPIVGSQGFYLNQNSTNRTTAQAFLDATMNTEFMTSIYEADPRPPAWIPAQAAAASDPIMKAISDYGVGGFPNLPWTQMGVVYEEVGLAQQRILNGADPKATMEQARANIESRTG